MREKKVRMGFETFRDKNKVKSEIKCDRDITVFEFIDSLFKIVHQQKNFDGNSILIDIYKNLTNLNDMDLNRTQNKNFIELVNMNIKN